MTACSYLKSYRALAIQGIDDMEKPTYDVAISFWLAWTSPWFAGVSHLQVAE